MTQVKPIYCKVYHAEQQTLLACADEEVLGKTLEEGKFHFEVREAFYKGQTVSKEELKTLFQEATTINLVGANCIETALEEKILIPGNVIKIKGVPHAQIYKL